MGVERSDSVDVAINELLPFEVPYRRFGTFLCLTFLALVTAGSIFFWGGVGWVGG